MTGTGLDFGDFDFPGCGPPTPDHQEGVQVAVVIERKRIDGKTVLHGACERARGYAFEPDDRKSKAFALACYEDSACDLMCDEDFSCVQFERREGYVQPHLGWVNEDALTEAKARGLIK